MVTHGIKVGEDLLGGRNFGWWIAMIHCVVFPVVVTLVVNGAHWPKFMEWLVSDSGAAWAQAFGAFVAILISVFGVMWLQDRERRKAAQLARLEWLQAVSGIADACRALVVGQHAVLSGEVFFPEELNERARPNRLETVCDALSSIDLQRAYPYELATAIITLQHVTKKSRRLISEALDAGEDAIPIDLEDCASRAELAYAVIEAELRKASDLYGREP